MGTLLRFFRDCLLEALRGRWLYWSWLAMLALIVAAGLVEYIGQVRTGLVVTGMSDQVSWGAYIANFTFLVGVAAAAVMLVIPAYVFHREHVKEVVLIGEGMAVAAVVMAMLFVVVDLGRPERFWHMIPPLGVLHLPESLLAWDVVVLTGYLLLNLGIPFYVLFNRYRGREPELRYYFPVVIVAILWAVSIHTVTAFLFSANVGRPFWYTAVLGPRFLASAFCSGPALMILVLRVIDRFTSFRVEPRVIGLLVVITTVALQVNVFLVGVELFTEFYNQPEHAASAQYLWFGLNGANALTPWIWTSLGLNLIAVTILSVQPLRARPDAEPRQRRFLDAYVHPTPTRKVLVNIACGMIVVGVWIEKGMGLVVPGFVPTPIGEVFEYGPTWPEMAISLAIWALGILIFTVLAKIAIPIEQGELRAD